MPKIGKALESALERGDEQGASSARRKQKSIMLNAARQRILEHLYSHPCSTQSQIASGIGASSSTVKWHLDILEGAGYVSSQQIKRHLVFYPSEMVSGEHVEMLAALNKPNALAALRIILGSQGISHGDLAKKMSATRQSALKSVQPLIDTDIVSIVLDGRYHRYYLGPALKEYLEASGPRIKQARKSILRKLAEDGLKAEVVSTSEKMLAIEISSGKNRAVLNLSFHPGLE